MKKTALLASSTLFTLLGGISCFAAGFENYSDYMNEDGTYSYYFMDEDLKVTFSEDWYQDTFLKVEDGYATFYHKRSYDGYLPDGFEAGRLFGLGASVNTSFTELPSYTYLGFSEETVMNYFAILPTDVQAYMEDEDVAEEYFRLFAEVDDVIADIELDGKKVGAGESETQEQGIDYMALVNKRNPLPEGWEDVLETVTLTNSVGDEVEVEAKAFEAYEQLRADLEEHDGIYIELDSARRSIAAQQDIMDRFIEKYGADYAAKTVATPGYSEHHTGLALDLYFRIEGDDGEFEDVYYNEDMVQYPQIWEKIHARLADYGFILRYLEGREHITGYGYEPWHIRYLDSVETAKTIMHEDITLEEYLGGFRAPEVEIDYGASELYTQEELKEAAIQIKCNFAVWEGCELHRLSYAGDEANNEENLAWLNSLDDGAAYTQVVEFLGDFHSPVEENEAGAWNLDQEYTDYQWWLARTEDSGWQLLSWGY